MTKPKSAINNAKSTITEPKTKINKRPSGLNFPIVGIGASAGGLAAFQAFFSGMPADIDPGMAFVLVQHLDPNHKSILSDLIRRYARMEVFEVEDGMIVRPNCAYIIPPNRDMAFFNGTLQLIEPSAPRGHRLPIDFFFRSLAQNLHERSICIILSGTGSDGTQGARAVKSEGGMVMVQTPTSAEYDGMPRMAIATGLVDFELPPEKMAAQIIAYVKRPFVKPSTLTNPATSKPQSALKKIFILVRNQTSHDISQYKISTINRHIERRMVVHQIETIDGYIKFLQQNPVEAEALFRDMLIGVTGFFRDPEAFKALEEQIIPKLFASKPTGAVIRVWSTGCSTGEEAYSIAILLQEQLEAQKKNYKVQVFATDIDSQAIASARVGRYPASITQHVSPERLARFFSAEADGSTYRIHKGIRDMLVFSVHDVIKDPPFSKLDLLSCRNLLIYMSGELQKKIIPLFHYALIPGGILFLGTSETIGEQVDLFATLDRKQKIFQRKEAFLIGQGASLDQIHWPMMPKEKDTPQFREKTVSFVSPQNRVPMRELTEQALLQQIAPAGALVNSQGDILYLYGHTGMYLELTPGEAGINNILKMGREGLRNDLTIALRKSAQNKSIVRCPGLRVKTNGDFSSVNLTIRPIITNHSEVPEASLFLVILEEAPILDFEKSDQLLRNNDAAPDDDKRIIELNKELEIKEEYLKASNEELETSNDELKSSNEEMQSVNEELQSTNEELETSQEELQSLNEELDSVNSELQTIVVDLSRANDDMNNLLAGTGIDTIFVDHQMQLLRFTPTTSKILNLIPSDIGRSVSHIASNLMDYKYFVTDIKAVLDTLIPKEVEVMTTTGAWYIMHIQPYRTIHNVIKGAVITFVDITEMKRIRDALSESEALNRLAVVVRDAHDAISVQDLEGRILAWNPGAERIFGWSEAEALKMNIRDLIPEDMRKWAKSLVIRLSKSDILKPYRMKHVAKDGRIVEVWLTATALVNEKGQIYAIATTERERRLENDTKNLK